VWIPTTRLTQLRALERWCRGPVRNIRVTTHDLMLVIAFPMSGPVLTNILHETRQLPWRIRTEWTRRTKSMKPSQIGCFCKLCLLDNHLIIYLSIFHYRSSFIFSGHKLTLIEVSKPDLRTRVVCELGIWLSSSLLR
jgi:hypothetical protein